MLGILMLQSVLLFNKLYKFQQVLTVLNLIMQINVYVLVARMVVALKEFLYIIH